MVKKSKKKSKKAKSTKKMSYNNKFQDPVMRGVTSQTFRNNFNLHQTYMEQVCSLIDPFCIHAKGAKIPDSNAAESITMQSRVLLTSTNDASGQSCITFFPNPSKCSYYAATYTGSLVATWSSGNSVNNYASMLSSCDYYRVVSWGVRAINIETGTAGAGVTIVTPIQGAGPLANNVFTTNSMYNTYKATYFSCRGFDVTFISKPNGGGNYRDYKLIDSTADANYECVAFSNFGGTASATSTLYELVVNYELLPKTGQFVASVATPAAKNNDEVMSTASRAQTTVENIINNVTRNASEVLEDAAIAAMKTGAVMLATRFAGPTGGTMAMRALGGMSNSQKAIM
jgi:hypothetical protein